MELYRAIVFIHAAAIFVFFMLHGVSMAVAFRLQREREPERVRALLDLSAWAMGYPAGVIVSIGLLAGIAAGVMGGWWTTAWFWVSLVLFVVVAVTMTPLAATRLHAIRAAAGAAPALGQRRKPDAPQPDAEELARLLDAWNPLAIAAIGMVAFLVILWLMLFKPF